MSTSRKRPRSVTLAVVLTAAFAVWDVAVAVLLFAAASSTDLRSDESTVVGFAAGISLAIAAASIALAVSLARGHNAGRLLFSLLLLFRLGYELVLGSGVASRPSSLVALVIVSTVVGLLLVWNPAATRFFESPAEHLLAQALTGTDESQSLGGRLGRLLADYLTRMVVLAITIGLTPGIQMVEWWALPLATVVVSLAGELLKPLLVRLTGLFGWLGSLALALFANAVVIGIGLLLTPGIEVETVRGTILASWVYALAMTVVSWAFAINTQDYLLMHAARMSLRRRPEHDLEEPGVLFVQLDGLPAPVLEFALKAGNLPTIGRWIRDGTHTWTEWVARVPSTTPVSQAGLLHGRNDDIPAFRWYEKEHGRLVVANHPPDAALIESRISDGCGLLADDGVSISNLFSGDAATSLLTMSGLRDKRAGLGPSMSYAAFFTHPAGFFRAVILTLGEMGKEVFQARRQRRLDMQPRIHRGAAYVLLRGATNVFLRDLNVALIVEAMMSGAKSIYVDFVDYDEIAHHAGVTRQESMDSLYGLDRMLAGLEKMATSGATPRKYHIVLTSDHGQSQGATFSQRSGRSLESLVLSLMQTDDDAAAVAATAEVEAWGPVNVFLGQLSHQSSVSARLTRRALRSRDAESSLGPSEIDHAAAAGTEPDDRPPVVVVGSGNLGGIWFPRLPGRLMLNDIETAYPGLVQGLVDEDAVGFAVVMTSAGPLAVGKAGTQLLTDASVIGEDPLRGYGPDARGDYLRAAQFEHAPDIYLNSVYEPVLGEVAAFEELVGCHGGVGGWQTRPVLVYPSDFSLDDDLLDAAGRLYGADMAHRQMVRWLERLGHRGGMTADEPAEDQSVASTLT